MLSPYCICKKGSSLHRHGKRQFLHKHVLSQKIFNLEKCLNRNKNVFAKKQPKLCLAKSRNFQDTVDRHCPLLKVKVKT